MFHYENGFIKFIATAEGYAGFSTRGFNYVYNYTDHLGNIRLSYTNDSSFGLLVVEENNYYPFGLKHQGYNNISPPNSVYKYKYQGQERQDEFGLNWDSFKWRNYDFAIGRFMSIDPLAEKYAYQSPYNFSENRVIDARELEGLEAQLVNENTIEWRVKVENNLGRDYSTTLLQDVSEILSQNGLTVKIIEDSNALFTISLSPTIIRQTEAGGIEVINGYTIDDGNSYDGTVVSKDSSRTIAHELGHKSGLPHIFDEKSKVENTEENKNNLMNSGANTIESLQNTSGTSLTPSQTTDMKNHINKVFEFRKGKEKDIKQENNNGN